MTSYRIIDTPNNVTSVLPQLKAAGVESIIRYIAPGAINGWKVINLPEVRAIAAAGLGLGLVFETTGRPSGTAQGASDGAYTMAKVKEFGFPLLGTAFVAYAVGDYDAQPTDFPGIAAAAEAFGKALSDPSGKRLVRLFAYASGGVNDYLKARGLIDDPWLTMSTGFYGTRAALSAGRYTLVQRAPERKLFGLDVDVNDQRDPNADLGFVRTAPMPFKTPTTVWPADDSEAVAWLQGMLNLKGALPPLSSDGVYGPLTSAAVKEYQARNGLTADGQAGPLTVARLVA